MNALRSLGSVRTCESTGINELAAAHRLQNASVDMGQRATTDLLIRIDPTIRGGLQQQIYSGIRRAILDGLVSPGTRLPSSRALARPPRLPRTASPRARSALLPGRSLSAP